jgi:hypothetical protein
MNEMNIAELAAYVCSHLEFNGIKCVLTGGACVSIYTENKYHSYDLDFIDNAFNSRKKLSEVMEKIGFYEKDRYFKNDYIEYLIEFPTGPLSIGSEEVTEIIELILPTGKLFIISPTDSVKDRLASYFYWDDKQSLEQAKLLCKSQTIDLNEVEKWSKLIGHIDKFKEIKNTLLE